MKGLGSLVLCLLLLSLLTHHCQSRPQGEEYELEAHNRTKRAIPFIPILISLVAGATVSQAANEMHKFHAATSGNQCSVGIVYCYDKLTDLGRSVVNMNFKSQFEDNFNREELSNSCSSDKTRERVDGGTLKLIQFHWQQGRSCVKALQFTCGAEVMGDRLKSVVVGRNEFVLRSRMQSLNGVAEKGVDCSFFSRTANGIDIRAIDFLPGIFNCGENDANCKANNMVIYLG